MPYDRWSMAWDLSGKVGNSMKMKPPERNMLLMEEIRLHPGRLTWNIIMEVWKIIFISKWVIWRFHVNLPGCNQLKLVTYSHSLQGGKHPQVVFGLLPSTVAPKNGGGWFR